MIDFKIDSVTGARPWCYFLYLMVYFMVLFFNWHNINGTYFPHKKKSFADYFLIIAVIFTSIFAFTRGDFYSYADVVQHDYNRDHLEDFYNWLIGFVNNNYLLWRIVVWGSALVLLLITVKRLDLDVRFTFLVFFLGFIQVFNYARVSLACALYFFGVSFFIKPFKPKVLSFIIAAAAIWCSNYFHSSVYVLIGITIFLFVPLNKWSIPLLLLAIIVIMQSSYSQLLNSMMYSDAIYADRFMQYVENSERGFLKGLSGFLTNTLEYGSILIPFVIITKNAFFANNTIPKCIRNLEKVLFGIIIVALMFVFTAPTIVFFYRILNMSIIPVSILISYFYTNSIMSRKEFKFCMYWFFANQLFYNLYSIYLKLL